jgi:paraquat-inducible protein B
MARVGRNGDDCYRI